MPRFSEGLKDERSRVLLKVQKEKVSGDKWVGEGEILSIQSSRRLASDSNTTSS